MRLENSKNKYEQIRQQLFGIYPVFPQEQKIIEIEICVEIIAKIKIFEDLI